MKGANPRVLLTLRKTFDGIDFRTEGGAFVSAERIEISDEQDLGTVATDLYHINGVKISRVFRNGKLFLDVKGIFHTTGIVKYPKPNGMVEVSVSTSETFSKIKRFPIMPSLQVPAEKISDAEHFQVY